MRRHVHHITLIQKIKTKHIQNKLDGCIVWNAHNTVLGEEARLIYIVPVCYVKTGRYGNLVMSLLIYTGKKISIITSIPVIIS